jgi:hypothetical protein
MFPRSTGFFSGNDSCGSSDDGFGFSCSSVFSDSGFSHSCNINGSPMCGGVDIHGNPFGVTSHND